MKNAITVVALLLLAACAKPIEMKNYETGKVVTCEGGVAPALLGGAIGHRVSRNRCVNQMRQAGFQRRRKYLDGYEARKKIEEEVMVEEIRPFK